MVAGVAVPAPIDATIRGAGPSTTQHTAQGGLFSYQIVGLFILRIFRVKGKMMDFSYNFYAIPSEPQSVILH